MRTAEQAMKQNKSWFSPSGAKNHPNLVGQIFFATNQDSLDAQDTQVLSKMLEYYDRRLRPKPAMLTLPVAFEFVGNADHRGTETYNRGLANRRAQIVAGRFDRKLGAYRSFGRAISSEGEANADRTDLAGCRRVDIWASRSESRKPIDLGEIHIKGDPGEGISNKFSFSVVTGFGLGISAVAAQILTINIRELRTNRVATYVYTGAGSGLGISVNRPSSEVDVEFPDWVHLEDFEGNGRVAGLGVFADTGTVLEFQGPMKRGRTSQPIRVTLDGWDFVVGGEVDALGYWHLKD